MNTNGNYRQGGSCLEVAERTQFKKNIIWNIEQDEYIVRDVPCIKVDAEDEEFLDLDVSLTVAALRDLMVEELIPNDVNYDDFSHIEF